VRRAAYSKVLDRIQDSIRGYVLIKTLLSLLMGALTFATLKVLGVDYAFFWAFVAFMANYIPTVGALVGIALPAVFALVQFPTPTTGLIVAAVLGGFHFVVGDVIEPRWMGTKLNISSFVVILSLVVWGKIWGITGMFLCVPLTVIMMIIFAQFPSTRKIAVLLSGDGDLSFARGAIPPEEGTEAHQ
jgi:predicted PurR-regulated permease PerM